MPPVGVVGSSDVMRGQSSTCAKFAAITGKITHVGLGLTCRTASADADTRPRAPSRVPRGFGARVVAVEALGQFVPLYPLYALLFADHGLSDAAISALFALWSVTTLVLEVPSGAWADVTSRRRMLAASGALAAAAFALWVLFPGTWVFALGFVLWGVGTALGSGTLEALTYDALAGWGATDRYATLMGRARSGLPRQHPRRRRRSPRRWWRSAATSCPVSSGPPPRSPPASWRSPCPRTPREPSAPTTSRDALAEWWTTLRDGLADVSRTALLRRAVLVTALLTGLMAFDEYLPLLAADRGASPAHDRAGRSPGWASRRRSASRSPAGSRAPAGPVLGALLAVAAVTVGAGALLPLGPGFAAIALGWGVLQMLLVVVETRVQDAVTGDARATVTSVAGLGSEGVALGVLAVVGTGLGLGRRCRCSWPRSPAPLLGVAVLLARS